MVTRLHLDGSGRVVIPKALRDACGIEQDTPLEVQRVGRELRLIPIDTVPPRQVLENGWVVFDTGSPHATDIQRLVEEEYERRSRHIAASR